MSKGLGQKITIKFTEAILPIVSLDISAFNVNGQEFKYIGGPIINKLYEVASVENHPTLSERHILITLNPNTRFNNTMESLIVSYDQAIGNLQGRGGVVESFIASFIPEDLETKPNPHAGEYITVSANATIDLLEVSYTNVIAAESISVVATVNVEFIHIDELNP